MKTLVNITVSLFLCVVAGCSSPAEEEPTDVPECNYGYIGCDVPGEACFLKDRGNGVCRGSCETTLACCFGCWNGESCRNDVPACGTEGEACAAPAAAYNCAKEGDACVTPFEGAAGTCTVLPDKCELGCLSN